MRYILLLALVATITVPVFAERFINFTDADGKRHEYELAEDSRGGNGIVVSRPDGSREALIGYKNGEFFQADTYRPDGSLEAGIQYKNGELSTAFTYRPDGSREALILYEDGELRQSSTHRPDGNREALIGYDNGELDVVCKGSECL